MCGIAGFVDADGGGDLAVVDKMLDELRHRGPDAQGWFGRDGGVVGQTRLSIIDLVNGDPPLTNEDGTIGVALNGEIYNFRDLQEMLRHDGHHLTSECDTEVIAHLAELEEDPTRLAARLHGMFSFAVWDSRRRRLILGRDRVGKKPLYYWAGPDQLVFGSEIKSLLAHPAVPTALDADAIPAYLSFGYVPSPRTFFRGIVALPPGHVLIAEPGRPPEIRRYWRPSVPGAGGVKRIEASLDEAAAELRKRLRVAVERRLVSDVPLGAFLSGGIDSSTIVALMAETGSSPPRTFTIGFQDRAGYDERPYARLVAQRYRTDHTEFVVEPHAIDLVERLVWHHDQPFGDSSAIPTYLLSELTRQHVTVALCGDGGDELFAGYERFAAGVAASRMAKIPGVTHGGADRLAALLPRSGRAAKLARFLSRAGAGLPDAFRQWISYVPDEWLEQLAPQATSWGLDDYRSIWAESEGAATLDRLLHLNIRTYLADDLLPKVDRMSMAHGLEVRAPFLDHELVEWALRLPPGVKQRGLSLKRCLKRVAQDLLPAELLNRPKRGFGVPLDRWFRDDLRDYLDETLGSPRARLRQHVVPEALDGLLAEHRAGVSHGHALWTLLTLEVFLRRHDW